MQGYLGLLWIYFVCRLYILYYVKLRDILPLRKEKVGWGCKFQSFLPLTFKKDSRVFFHDSDDQLLWCITSVSANSSRGGTGTHNIANYWLSKEGSLC